MNMAITLHYNVIAAILPLYIKQSLHESLLCFLNIPGSMTLLYILFTQKIIPRKCQTVIMYAPIISATTDFLLKTALLWKKHYSIITEDYMTYFGLHLHFEFNALYHGNSRMVKIITTTIIPFIWQG